MKAHTVLFMGLALSMGGLFAAESPDVAGSSMTVKLPHRTIKTDEKRWETAEGQMVGSFLQHIKGNGSPEDLKQTGPYSKEDDKEIYTLDEQGVTETGKRVENKLTITRDLVGGILTEILRRTPKKEAKTPQEKIELLGGLPGVVNTRTNQDGSRHIETWNDPDPKPGDKPDDVVDIPGDDDGTRPTRPHIKFDDFILIHVKGKDDDNGPPKGDPDPKLDKIPTVVVTPPVTPGPITPPVTPPVTPPTPPSRTGPSYIP